MVSRQFTLEDAHALAMEAHAGQVDKLGVDYMEHVRAVADGLADYDLELQIAAMLHDAVEDGEGITLELLRGEGVSERALAVLALVSNNLHAGMPYADVIAQVATSYDATLVKIADNAHNSRPDRVAALAARTGKPPTTKYVEARRVLWRAVAREDVARIVGRVAPDLLVTEQPQLRPDAQVD